MSWITFDKVGASRSGRTQVWAVNVADPEVIANRLGTVKWFPHWRKYAFLPNAETVFESDCLRVIADFCTDQTGAQRMIAKSHRVTPGEARDSSGGPRTRAGSS